MPTYAFKVTCTAVLTETWELEVPEGTEDVEEYCLDNLADGECVDEQASDEQDREIVPGSLHNV